MLSAREAILAVAGAWRLARLDAKGTQFFNATVQGFWNSFWVAALLLPLHMLGMALDVPKLDETVDPIRYFSVELIMYAMSWVAFPLVMFHICEAVGKGHRFLRFGIANNWTDLIVYVVTMPVQLAISLELIDGATLSFLLAAAYVYALTVAWFVARYTLNLGGLAAVGVVMLALFINIFIRIFGSTLIY